MATRKTETAPEAPAEETVIETDPWKVKKTVYIPRGADKYESEFVCVNGRSYMVPKGKQIEVPAPIAEAIENAQMTQAWAADEKERIRKNEQR